MKYTHRIVHLGIGVRCWTLRFTSQAEAQQWIDEYPVSAQYKETNYRIMPIAQAPDVLPEPLGGVAEADVEEVGGSHSNAGRVHSGARR